MDTGKLAITGKWLVLFGLVFRVFFVAVIPSIKVQEGEKRGLNLSLFRLLDKELDHQSTGKQGYSSYLPHKCWTKCV